MSAPEARGSRAAPLSVVLPSLASDRATRASIVFGIIAAIAMAAVVVGLGVGARVRPLHLGILAVGVAAFLALRRPPLGMVGLVVAGLAVPFTIGTGTESRVDVAMLIVAGLTFFWLLEAVIRHEARLAITSSEGAALALAAVALVAFAAGTQPALMFAETAPLRAQIGGLSLLLFSVCAFLLAAHRLPDLRWLQWMMCAFLTVGAIHVWVRLMPGGVAVSTTMLGQDQLGSLFWVWFAALAFGQAVFNRELRPGWRFALAASVAACLVVGVSNKEWTSGWLPAVVAVVVTLLAGAPRFAPLILVGGGGLAIGLLPRVLAFIIGDTNQYSISTRLEAWRILGEIISANPILGLGFANYYWYTPLFPIMGYAVKFNSHNNYVDIVAQTGLVGLACFLWFAVAVGLLAWRLCRRAAPGFNRAYAASALGGLVGTLIAGMLGDWIIPFVYNVGFAGFGASVLAWVFLGGLIALDRMTSHDAADEVANVSVR